MQDVFQQFVAGMKATTPLEYAAVASGIISVWFSKKENILVYPTGLINTIIYVYISFKSRLIGKAGVNFYYTVVSIWGWILWARKNNQQETILHITFSTKKEWAFQLAFCTGLYIALFSLLTYLKTSFYGGVIPWADAFASATAFTAMWLMAKKKAESWWWWIATNIASIPLYFVKGLVFTSVYYIILLMLAAAGLLEWRQRAKAFIRQTGFDFEKA